MTVLLDLATKVRDLLTGEPLRAISYGSIAVVYLVSRAGVLLGFLDGVPDLEAITLSVTAVVAAITELSRRFTFSAKTVAAIAVSNTPIVAAADAGVNPIVLSSAIEAQG